MGVRIPRRLPNLSALQTRRLALLIKWIILLFLSPQRLPDSPFRRAEIKSNKSPRRRAEAETPCGAGDAPATHRDTTRRNETLRNRTSRGTRSPKPNRRLRQWLPSNLCSLFCPKIGIEIEARRSASYLPDRACLRTPETFHSPEEDSALFRMRKSRGQG